MEIAQTADYALQTLLELEARDGQTMSQLTASLGLNRSVVHRTVVTLRRRAALSRDTAGRYWLGPLIVRLGSELPHELAHVGRDHLRRLAERIEETAVLAVREGGDSVVIAQAGGHRGPLRVEYEVDFHQPLDQGASSLAILAHLDQDRDGPLPAGRDDDLSGIRERGYARTVGEIKPYMMGLAAPILTRAGIAGSLAVVAPTTRSAHIDDVRDDVVTTAAEISAAYDAYLDRRAEPRP